MTSTGDQDPVVVYVCVCMCGWVGGNDHTKGRAHATKADATEGAEGKCVRADGRSEQVGARGCRSNQCRVVSCRRVGR